MKSALKLLLPVWLLAVLLPAGGSCAGPPPADTIQFDRWLDGAYSEVDHLERAFQLETQPLRQRLAELENALQDPRNRNPETGFPLLWEQNQLTRTLDGLLQEHELKLLKMRYRKSIEIVKMLYEKVLSMDHHFSSLKAQQDLLNLSNPHHYPEFKENRALIEDKIRKKSGFTLPDILKSNPYMSAAFSVVGLVLSGADDREKKSTANLDNVACILDFTVRMHNDLNVIYYETGYLRDANLTLKKECETLFSECARQVGYSIPLASCRDGDDWERLYTMLDAFVAKALGETTGTPGNGSTSGYATGGYAGTGTTAQPDPRLVQRASVNLQFSVDRVTQFIEKYSNFVGQGSEYYKKFSKIVHNYENEKACAQNLPEQYTQLKDDIELTLEKFNSAYRMPEIQGSKLKDMLYGTLTE